MSCRLRAASDQVTDVADTESKPSRSRERDDPRERPHPPLTDRGRPLPRERRRVPGRCLGEYGRRPSSRRPCRALLAPAHVEYYLAATGQRRAHPRRIRATRPASLLDYDVGANTCCASITSTSVTTWRGRTGRTATLESEDDWQRGSFVREDTASGGIAWSDPTHGRQRRRVLGQRPRPRREHGAYSADVQRWLRSPPVDCSNGRRHAAPLQCAG
jgi:hypothetical protein